ncbi:MAG TPA: NYN domain-containing protein [Candidatus Hydrogenedentes bacterium]|nr:NYN domain-containing protein [Candidatus Hydrogenedentota bacterium]
MDGQNLYHGAREAFGYSYPNYDIGALAQTLCSVRGWMLLQTRFYTGVPDACDSERWHKFWSAKLLAMSRQGIHTYSRSLRYRNKVVTLPDGRDTSIRTGEEKGIDVRIAIDIIRMAHRREYDVALVFSQDQDLSEVARELRVIAKEQARWIKMSSAYPENLNQDNNAALTQRTGFQFPEHAMTPVSIHATIAPAGNHSGCGIGNEPLLGSGCFVN